MIGNLEHAHKLYEMTDDYFNLGQQSLINKWELDVQWGGSVLEALLGRAYKLGLEARDNVNLTNKP